MSDTNSNYTNKKGGFINGAAFDDDEDDDFRIGKGNAIKNRRETEDYWNYLS